MSIKNKKLIKIGAVALAVIFFLVCAIFVVDSMGPANPKAYKKFFLSTFNGSYEADGLPKTYWQIEPRQDDDGNRVPTYAKFSLSTVDTANIGQIWVNISDLKEKEAKITIGYGYSYETFEVAGSMVVTASELKADEDGWIKIYDSTNSGDIKVFTSKHVWVGFENNLRVREIAFIDANSKAPEEVNLKGMSYNGMKEIAADKLSGKDNNVNNIVDEPKTFA